MCGLRSTVFSGVVRGRGNGTIGTSDWSGGSGVHGGQATKALRRSTLVPSRDHVGQSWDSGRSLVCAHGIPLSLERYHSRPSYMGCRGAHSSTGARTTPATHPVQVAPAYVNDALISCTSLTFQASLTWDGDAWSRLVACCVCVSAIVCPWHVRLELSRRVSRFCRRGYP